ASISIGINTVTPQFDAIPAFCENTTAPILPLTSTNGITGTWNPATVSNTASGTYTFTPNPNQCATVAFLTITVTPRTVTTFTFGTTASVCQGAPTQILPTTSSNGINGTWSPSTVDNSNVGTTTYNFTPNPSECATVTSYTVTVNPNVIATLNPIAPLCSGETAPVLPTTSNNGYLGTWSPATVSNTTSGSYTFTPNAGQCALSTTLNVTVYPSPTDIQTIIANVLNNTAMGMIEITGVTSGVAPYLYSINNGPFTSILTYSNLSPGDYILTVQDANGCKYSKLVTVTSTCLFPNGISPNNDQKNDTFNLDGCNVKRLELFNRYGMKVNGYDEYVKEWDGTTSDGKELPDGTYFYVAELKDGTTKTGWVYIAR
ncbi:MAG: gliding motility-associated C-terminal domain-containing protein, partial [Flavobacterium sp.]|nr:gliding motility-associated C-terminal domain-containing protein [Flavobacterium sp.]